MRKLFLLISVLSSVCIYINISYGAQYWAKTYGGSEQDIANCIEQTADGGYIVAGQTESFSDGGMDLWVLKLDSNGDVIWQKTYVGSVYGWAISIQQTSDGGYVLASSTYSLDVGGYDFWILRLDVNGDVSWQRTYSISKSDRLQSIQQTMDGGYIASGNSRSFDDKGYDVWVLKLDSNGDVIWQKTYGGSHFGNRANFIQQTEEGGYIIAGTSVSSTNMWILKLDSGGTFNWHKTYSARSHNEANSIQQTSDGGYVVAGGTSLVGGADWDIWILKLDSNGDIIWQKIYGGNLRVRDTAKSILQTKDTGYVVVGDTESFGAGGSDFWILKLNEEGIISWEKTYGEGDYEYGNSIQQTSDGGYIVAGRANSFGAGFGDILVLKLNSSGDIPSCNIINNSDAFGVNSFVVGENRDCTVQVSLVSIHTTNVVPKISEAEISKVCDGDSTITTTIDDEVPATTTTVAGYIDCILDIYVSPEEGGTTSPPPGSYFLQGCYPKKHTVNALPNPGYLFSYWELGDVQVSINPIAVDIGVSSVMAVFKTITSTTVSEQPCSVKEIYGEHSKETELLRSFRDNVLSQTSEGQELIRLYYEWSPAIVKEMEEDEGFKENIKEMIDGILPLINIQVD